MKYVTPKTWLQIASGLLFSFLFIALTACASDLANHSFSFDVISDSTNVQVIDYRYGDSQISATRADKSRPWPRGYGGTNVNGDFLRGDSLYVKWKIESTGKVYEDSVDLKRLLPRDITKHRIHFIVKDTQLFVYLITPELRSPDTEPNGPRAYDFRKVITLSSNFGREVTSP